MLLGAKGFRVPVSGRFVRRIAGILGCWGLGGAGYPYDHQVGPVFLHRVHARYERPHDEGSS